MPGSCYILELSCQNNNRTLVSNYVNYNYCRRVRKGFWEDGRGNKKKKGERKMRGRKKRSKKEEKGKRIGRKNIYFQICIIVLENFILLRIY